MAITCLTFFFNSAFPPISGGYHLHKQCTSRNKESACLVFSMFPHSSHFALPEVISKAPKETPSEDILLGAICRIVMPFFYC